MARRAWWGVAAGVVPLAAAIACGSTGVGATADAGVDDASTPVLDASAAVDARDAAEIDATPPTSTITITTQGGAGKAIPTWAARRSADGGAWTEMTADGGTYTFEVAEPEWSAAFGCAATGHDGSVVAIQRWPRSRTSLEVALDEECVPIPNDAFDVTGNLTNLPSATTWLEFGYPRDSRGVVLAVAGARASYEEINVEPGTWDLAFGVRDTSGGPLTRVMLKRGQAVTANVTLDLDFAAALRPVPKNLDVRGLAGNESLDVSVFHVAGVGALGLAVGPQDVPPAANVHVTYDALPEAALATGDRYHLSLRASASSNGTARGLDGVFHDAVDVDTTLPAALAAPVVTVTQADAGATVTATAPTAAGAAAIEVLASTPLPRNQRRAIKITMDPALAPAAIDVTSDLASAPGFRPEWRLAPAKPVTVAVTARGAPAALSDGTSTWISSRSTTVNP